MYHYVEDKEFISRMRSLCGEIMQDLCHELKEQYDIGSIAVLIGSGAKKLITQNEGEPIDLDYNLEIVRCEDINDCRTLKENVRKTFNSVLRSHGWSDCEDSTSSLTTEQRHFTSGNSTFFSIDVAIVTRSSDKYYRLIHQKTGWIYQDKYFWNEAPNSHKLKSKIDFIKSHGKWQLVQEQYLSIKNRYLRQNDHNHPSFICYVEAVNNVYNTKGHW